MTQTMNMTIGDRSVPASSGRTLEVTNPATEQVHAHVPEADAGDVEQAVAAARRAFEGPWSRMNPTERGRLLHRLAALVETHSEELALMDTQDMGKPFAHSSRHDLPGAVSLIEFYAGFCDKIRGSLVPNGPGMHVYVSREPVGVVAGIIPWNFPFLIAVQKLGPALACGNTIVLKPAEQSPRSVLRLAELCLEAGIPPGVVNAVSGLGETVGATLAAHPGVDKVSFTGSTEVGRRVMHAAADQIHKVTLELGGKTANIVFADADFDAALASCVFTSCYNTGQICTTGSRLVIDRRIHDRFLAGLQDRMKALKVGDPMDPSTKLGPLVSREQHRKVSHYIQLGKEGYKHFEGGFRAGTLDCGFYVDPIVFDHVRPDAAISQEEIFGPVLSVLDFEREQEALEIANGTRYGLATAIWTSDLSRAHRLAAACDSGIVWINCNNYLASSIPYEGHRQSGIGADMGTEAVESYMKIKSTVINLDNAPNPWGCA
jgi:acyl-CoA reductase-like NAD-dependent aldehyde dehydrogenase